MKQLLASIGIFVAWLPSGSAMGGDWPQFRYDAGRTAASPDELPDGLRLRWTRTLPRPRPAFPHELRLAFDASYEPVVFGHTLLLPSMVDDSVTALDTETGVERWRFFAEGPVRFAPAVWGGQIYFVSDDGWLYCLNQDGSLRWKFRGLPQDRQDRKVLGHGRLISLWPARGGPVVADGIVYFAAGLWPNEGVFVHAVDAASGKPIWSNTTCGHIPGSNLDHGVEAVAGLSPQGYLAIAGDRLIVPCGQQLPAFLDRRTGELAGYTTGWGGRIGLPKGCWFVAAQGHYLSHGGDLYDISRRNEERMPEKKAGAKNFKPRLYPGGWTRLDVERANQRELDFFQQPVLTPDVLYESDGGIVARDLAQYSLRERVQQGIPAHRAKDELPDNFGGVFRRLWQLPSNLAVHIKAGRRLYAGAANVVEAIDTAAVPTPKVVWRAEFQGTPQRMLAADGKLFIVTLEGRILAFAAGEGARVVAHEPAGSEPPPADSWTAQADAVLAASGVREGYALVWGIDQGRLVEELARRSALHVIALSEDAVRIAAIRKRLHAAGLYGARATILAGDPAAYPLPPYLASLVVSERPDIWNPAVIAAAFHVLRPYGGTLCVGGRAVDRRRLEQIVQGARFAGAEIRDKADRLLVVRRGPLPGASDWSHAEANAASTGASDDRFVRSPLSLLWFDAENRWHKYPGQNQVRVAGGRLVLYEKGLLRASDVYTGRTLWEVELPDAPPDRSRARYAWHRQWGPEANLPPATELVATEDAIYLGEGSSVAVWDPATGRRTHRIPLPPDLRSPWTNLRVVDDYLVGSSGRTVVCVQRQTGRLLWRVDAASEPLYLAAGGDRVFCAELAAPGSKNDDDRKRAIFALNLTTGETIWRRPGGARLRYCPQLDLVVTAGGLLRAQDGEPLPRPADAPNAPLVFTGSGLPKTGIPGLIAGQRLLTGNDELLAVFDLPSIRRLGDPLKWSRRGCTGPRASAHLLTTRCHGNSAWIDLDSGQITPFLGIRPACSINNNLYPANGVLNMPNLTAGCTCNYLPVSMACVPTRVLQRAAAE